MGELRQKRRDSRRGVDAELGDRRREERKELRSLGRRQPRHDRVHLLRRQHVSSPFKRAALV